MPNIAAGQTASTRAIRLHLLWAGIEAVQPLGNPDVVPNRPEKRPRVSSA